MYELRFKRSVLKDIKRIGEFNSKRIMKNIRKKLLINPRAGIQLKGKDGTLWRFRIGEFRKIYTFSEKELYVLVLRIAHRREAYKNP